MKTSSIFCLIAIGLLVSIVQQANSKGTGGMKMSLAFCNKLICGRECFGSDMFGSTCYCTGPCTEKEIKAIMEATGSSRREAKKMVEQGESYNPDRV